MADMFKNQLQELAQRSCFNLPSYACVREGPDHAPRFKASVNFNGEIFESPSYCTTLRQAEHAAAEVALNVLSSRGPSRSLTARVLDETGIYKNLLQETAHRAGLNLPVYTTIRSGPGHVPTFTCTVELAGMNFTGEPAKTKKQAEKNAAIAAWSALKRMPSLDYLTNKEVVESREEQDQAVVARVLSNFRSKDEYNKQARKKDCSQARRRLVKGYRDYSSASSSSSSTSSNSLHYQHRKLLDLLLDSALDSSTQKQSSFVSLLPPPPPRTTSKILPPTSPIDNPYSYPSSRCNPHQIQVKGKQQTKEIEEHQKDEEEWPGAIKKSIEKESSSSSVYGSSSLYRQFPHQESTSHIGNRIFGPSSTSIKSTPSSIHMCSNSPFYSGMLYPHRIAPAVQIRSVIPVCAAPPAAVRPAPAPAPSSSTTTITAKSTQAGAGAGAAAEVSMSSSMVNKTTTTTEPSSHPTQLSSSEFNKKLQL
ncbi:double-stranded RNA binding protein, putative [Ricinus communis]|uniref:Double-stranded RNA binding protein, putative n=1 Tax=Ricinus communis TaxID=3988 RepID=B9RH31_RICCO|nr:double-stranded RNA binding protein, putative [Ricinus communis]